jgi:hypothetical protein
VVTTKEFGAKYQSKQEVYRFLSFDVGAYLPPYDTVTVWHLRDLACGQRRLIKSTEVKVMQVPHFEGLTIERMLHNANKAPEIMSAFPIEEREIDKFPRAYIANVMFTIIGDTFRTWFLRKCEERHAKIVAT